MRDVTFVLEDERTFCIEVGFLDSFQEIKEKVENHTGIPACRQTLLFNGKILPNNAFIFDIDIGEASRLQLLVASDSGNPVTPPILSPAPTSNEYDEMLQLILDMPTPNREEIEELLSLPLEPQTTSPAPQTPVTVSDNTSLPRNPEFTPYSPPPQPPTTTTVEFVVKIMNSRARPFFIEMRLDDTVLQLKEKVCKMKKRQKLEANDTQVLIKSGEELEDHRSMRDCGMLSISHVYVRKRSSQPIFGRMLKVMVVPKGETQKVPIEVNCRCSVGDLRFELEKFHKHLLPKNGCYFFTNKKNGHVMNELSVFNGHIEDGDTIEITPEYVSD